MQSFNRQPAFQINEVWAKNFRSISDTSVALDPLTVLVGSNASGKSNLLDILRFIKDALRFDLEAAISIRHGLGAIYHHESPDEQSDIELGISATFRTSEADGSRFIDYGFNLTGTRDGGYKVSREYGKIWNGDRNSDPVEFRIEEGDLVSPQSLIFQKSQTRLFQEEEDSDFDTADLAFPTLLRIIRRLTVHGSEPRELAALLIYSALTILHRNLSNMRFYHIFPNTIREPQKLGNGFPLEEDAANLASTLRDMEKERPSQLIRLKECLGRLIPGVSDLQVTSAGGYLVVRLKHDAVRGGAWFDLSQESDGTVRLLGLLAALYQRRPLSLIGIEEPELTVHPGALSVLADVLNEAARRSQVIVTTHSPDFIDCVTNSRAIENLRIVELVQGVTEVMQVSDAQVKAVRQHLFSPGELHRMGEFRLKQGTDEQ